MKANEQDTTSDGTGRRSTGSCASEPSGTIARTARRRPSGGGRWATRCQHYGLPAGSQPAAPETAAPLRGSLLRILRDLNLETQAAQWALERDWAGLVGRPLDRHTRPGPLAEGRLTVYVSSPTWKFEIDRHLGGPLLQHLREARPELALQSLSVRIDPGRTPDPRRSHTGGS